MHRSERFQTNQTELKSDKNVSEEKHFLWIVDRQ